MTDSTSIEQLEQNVRNALMSRPKALLTSAITLAVVGTVGSVLLSVGLGLKACPLCFYQRSFVMAALVVLALGRFLEPTRPGLICLLCVPLAWAGFGVAMFHYHLEATRVLECPLVLNFLSAPTLSLFVFLMLASDVTYAAWYGRHESPRQGAKTLIVTALVGVVLAVACVKSSPPLPQVPTVAYDPVKQPLDTCRRPFRIEPRSP